MVTCWDLNTMVLSWEYILLYVLYHDFNELKIMFELEKYQKRESKDITISLYDEDTASISYNEEMDSTSTIFSI